MFSWSSNRRGGPAAAAAASSTSADSSSWASSSAGSAYPGARAATTATAVHGSIRPPDNNSGGGFTRQKHIDSYLNDDTLKRSTRRVSADDTTYDTVFSTVSGDTLILRIHLAPCPHAAAPVTRPPAMTLAGVSAKHAWLDRRMRITGYPAIASDQAWKESRLLLGTAVKQVIQHLQVSPPEIVQITDEALKVIQQPKTNNNNNNNRNNSNTSTSATAASRIGGGSFPAHPPQHHHVYSNSTASATDAPPDYETVLNVPSMEMPSIPAYYDELDSKDLQQLNQLLNNEVTFMDFCKKLAVTRTIAQISTSVITDNAQMARDNLKQQNALRDLHGEVTKLDKQLQERVKKFRQLEQQQDKLCAPPNANVVLRRLTKAKKQAFDESEQIAEEWVESSNGNDEGTTGAQSVDAFVKSFLEKRKVHHLRAAKMEVLKRQGSKAI